MTAVIVLAVLYLGVAIGTDAMSNAYVRARNLTPKRSRPAQLALSLAWPYLIARAIGGVIGDWLAKR